MKIRQPAHYPIIQQFKSPIQYVTVAFPTQRFSQGQRVASPNSVQNDYQRLRNTQSIQEGANVNKIPKATSQQVVNKKPHIKMPQQGFALSQTQFQSQSYDPQTMVSLIKENQEIKGKIIEKEKQLILLQQEIAKYEQKS